MILLFSARAERGHHVDGGAEIVDGLVLAGDGLEQRVAIGDEEGLAWLAALAGDQRGAGEAGRRARATIRQSRNRAAGTRLKVIISL